MAQNMPTADYSFPEVNCCCCCFVYVNTLSDYANAMKQKTYKNNVGTINAQMETISLQLLLINIVQHVNDVMQFYEVLNFSDCVLMKCLFIFH